MEAREMPKQPELTEEQKKEIKEMQELQGKVNEAKKVISETLKRLGLEFYIDHVIKIVPTNLKQE